MTTSVPQIISLIGKGGTFCSESHDLCVILLNNNN
jgi:hypothetical protein